MKKIALTIVVLLITIIMLTGSAFAVEEKNIIETTEKVGIMKEKNQIQAKINEYIESYDSETYGTTAFILDTIRIYSIPLCFVGIVIGALYQYVLGTRRLDYKHRGFGVIIASITVLVICQVLPLIFLIVVKGWRG